MKFLPSIVVASLLVVASSAHARTLKEFTVDVSRMSTAVIGILQDDARDRDAQTRESSKELFPAYTGAKNTLTISQQNLLRRCDAMFAKTMRCSALQCRLTGENCRR